MWYIYKHTFPNGKIYIGLSKQRQDKRFKYGLGYEKCPVIYKAIQKYGWNSISSEIIEDNISTIEEANEREKYWIKYYNSYINFEKSNGYNATIGGGGINQYDWEEIYKEWLNGKSSVEITNQFGICKDAITNVLDAYNVSEEERKEHLVKVQSKSQRKFDRENIFKMWNDGMTSKEIQEKLKCSRDVVRRTLDEYNVSQEQRIKRSHEELAKSSNGNNKKKVDQYDLNNNFIQTFNSIKDANLFIGSPPNSGNISQVCRGKKKTAGGFIWKYHED